MSKLKTVKITDTIYPNLGIGHYGDQNHEIRVKNALVGQEVEALPGRRRKNFRKGSVYSINERSPMETEEGCVHKEDCGGCTYQSLTYEKELEYKLEQLQNLYDRLNLTVEEIIPSPEYMYYRNNMEYTFGDEYIGSPLALGMHKKNRFYERVNVDHCLICHSDFNTIHSSVREYFRDSVLTHYDKKRHTGNLRHLAIKRSTLGEILVNLVITHDTDLDEEKFLELLQSLDLEGEIVSVYITYNDALADAIVPEKVELIYGREYIIERLLDLEFKIGPFSFFQTNTKSAEKLFEIGIDMLEDFDSKVVYDLYSGTGTISQIMAKKAKKVYGIEIVEEAVEGARASAAENDIDNVEFICGDVLKKIDQLTEEPDVIVVDPPRAGIAPKAMDKILDRSVEQILYISCNPVTQLDNIKQAKECGYKVQRLVAVDQFPRTPHAEMIALLVKES